MILRLLLPLLLLLAGPGCSPDPVDQPAGGGPPVAGSETVEIGPADLRVLFVGNSLTHSNDLPGVVAALAADAGLSFAHATVARPGWSLQEHWQAGIAEVIASVAADVVVLQQGPSSLPESRTHLAYWTGRLAPVIRGAGGEPALLMVWPDRSRAAFFPDVRESYAAAAASVDGIFIPAGQAWVHAWEIDGTLALWGADDFHPTYLGTLAAAMAAFAVLFDADPSTIGDLSDTAPAAHVAVLREAVGVAVH